MKSISNYSFFRKDRLGSLGGGVVLYFKNKFNLSPITFDSDLEIIGAAYVIENGKPLLICAIYMPPSSTLQHFMELYSLLSPFQKSHSLILAGDFNLSDIDWSSLHLLNYNNKISGTFIDFLFEFNLDQKILLPTRSTSLTSNVLDLIIIPPHLTVNSNTILPGLSDHDVPFIDFTLHIPLSPSSISIYYDFSKTDPSVIKNKLVNSLPEFTELSNTNDITLLWNHFKNIIFSILSSLPTKIKRKKSSKPWINRNIIHLKRKCRRLSFKMKKDPTHSLLKLSYSSSFSALEAANY